MSMEASPFVINEVTNHFIKKSFSRVPLYSPPVSHLAEFNSPKSPPWISGAMQNYYSNQCAPFSKVILVSLTRLWCPTKSREITPRINLAPLIGCLGEKLFLFVLSPCFIGLGL